jgi:hypothetical protein
VRPAEPHPGHFCIVGFAASMTSRCEMRQWSTIA